VDIDTLTARAAAFCVALPFWGVGTGGTRFARFPGIGEPRGIFEKLDDCAVIHQLGRATPRVLLHIPWDAADPAELKAKADSLGLGFDAMNSNTFQDHPGLSHGGDEGKRFVVAAAPLPRDPALVRRWSGYGGRVQWARCRPSR
jgi:L-rhamnose isomerase